MSDTPTYTDEMPAPIPTGGPSMHDLVGEDMRERKEHGLRKYGTVLQAGNGRPALQDAYEEVLDLVVYLRQEIEERRGSRTFEREDEWGISVAGPGEPEMVFIRDAEREAREDTADSGLHPGGRIARRTVTVTYGPWVEVQ